MRTALLLTFPIFLLFAGCGPKNEKLSEVDTDIEPKDEIADTITNTRKDGVQTDDNIVSPTFPLPPDVLQILNNKYPNSKELTFTNEVLNRAETNIQGPGIIRGDFDGNGRQDYAVQLQDQKQLVVVATLHNTDGSWHVQEIKQDILFNDRGQLKSPYMLRLVKKGEELLNQTTRNQITAPYDAIMLSLNGDGVIYLYEEGKFAPYMPADQ
jgi:hypothetical protein